MGANIKFIAKRSIGIASSIFSILSIVLSIWTWEELGVIGSTNKVFVFASILLLSIVIAIIWTAMSKKKKEWEQGHASIVVQYGDLIKIGFPKGCLKLTKRIVVIPVNTHFDTIVNDEIVASSSLHGQWINYLCSNGETSDSINYKIQEQIASQNVLSCHDDLSKKGNKTAYPLGTVVKYTYEKTIFYLVALAEYDVNLQAHCDKEQLQDIIKLIIDFYDKYGQGYPIYIPLMGTELSRTGISESESLRLIVDLCMLYRDKIHGEANVVVYKKHRTQVPIFE